MTNRRAVRRKDAEQPRRGLSRELKMLLGIGAVLIVVAIGVLALGGSSSSTDTAEPPAAASDGGQLIRDDSYLIEAPGAAVTLVEFLDPECEACGAMYPVVSRILDEYEGRLTFVVRYFPLHNNSVLAAKAYEAAGRQGKYWEMYALLFQNQGAWGEKREPQTELFVQYAQNLGLDIARFRADLNDRALDEKVSRDRADGVALGVRGTPTFFINGELAGSVMTYQELKGKIDAALR